MDSSPPPPTSEEVDRYAREVFGVSVSLPLEGRTRESCLRIQKAFWSRMHAVAPQLKIEFTWFSCNSPGQIIIDECGPLRIVDGSVQSPPKITRFGCDMAHALAARIEPELLAAIEPGA